MIPASQNASAKRPWWSEPAWITLLVAMIIQLAVFAYSFGHLNARVEFLMEQQKRVFQILHDRRLLDDGH